MNLRGVATSCPLPTQRYPFHTKEAMPNLHYEACDDAAIQDQVLKATVRLLQQGEEISAQDIAQSEGLAIAQVQYTLGTLRANAPGSTLQMH